MTLIDPCTDICVLDNNFTFSKHCLKKHFFPKSIHPISSWSWQTKINQGIKLSSTIEAEYRNRNRKVNRFIHSILEVTEDVKFQLVKLNDKKIRVVSSERIFIHSFKKKRARYIYNNTIYAYAIFLPNSHFMSKETLETATIISKKI
jgi:hypothetical protein